MFVVEPTHFVDGRFDALIIVAVVAVLRLTVSVASAVVAVAATPPGRRCRRVLKVVDAEVWIPSLLEADSVDLRLLGVLKWR